MRKFILIFFLLSIVNLYSDSHGGWIRNEYKKGLVVEIKTLDNKIEFKVYGNTKGWIAIGFEPSIMMKDSDIIIGYVKDNKVVIEDHFSHTMTGHKSDESLGGENNLEIIDGSEVDGVTMLHFALPIESKDKFDISLIPGKSYKIIFATGRDDNLKAKHNFRGSDRLNIPVKSVE